MAVIFDAQEKIKQIILSAIEKAQSEGRLAVAETREFNVELPADRANGDFSTNAAMVLAKAFKMPPRALADIIVDNADISGGYFQKIEVAGPGFINFFANSAYFSDVLVEVENMGDDFGRSDFGKGEKINVEFVSANPTGPMHMGNARGGALGDCLAAILDYAGYDVTREFYINDAGNQIEKFALSLDIRYQQLFLGEDAVTLPEDSYHGQDIIVLAKEFAFINGDKYLSASESDRRKALVDFALPKNIANMKRVMDKYRIDYDVWFHESVLHNDGELKEVLEILTNAGYTYEKDGALWYKNAEVQTNMLLAQGKKQGYIDNLKLKDDVLIRANGNPTYFLADIAYHRNKLEKRGFSKAIDIWGADHHGHVARMQGAMQALGIDPNRLTVLLMQLVHIKENDKILKMSKRSGKAISLDMLLDEVPIDAVRFLFNTREPGSAMDFDLSLAKEQSNSNPVYYCQYAHARICSIIAKLKSENKELCCKKEYLSLLSDPVERELIAFISQLPSVIVSCASNYDPARITQYALNLGALFHKFYNSCRVNVENEQLMQARAYLCLRVKDTMSSILKLMKIDRPEKM